MKLPTLLSLALLALLLSALAAPVPASPLTLYVSPQGHDGALGTQTAPLATLAGARDRLRSLKGANKLPKEGAIVWIRGGAYRLRDTFTLTGADDLSPAPVTYAAYHGEPVRLTGGQEVKGWKPVTDPAILGRLDPTARGHVLQTDLKAQGITDYGQMTPRGFAKPVTPAGLELFFQDTPMTLARWPNAGQWARVAGAASDQGADHFSYEGDRPARWAQAEDAWVYGYWQFDWADSYAKIQGVDAAHHQIRAAQSGDLLSYTPGHRWYALNLLEELDTPGEWYLDRKTGVLYFWPPSDIKKGRPTVSLTRDLVRLDGVSHVTLRGLTLEACRGDAVTIRGGAHDLVDGCTIRSAGNRGATIAGATDSGVRGALLVVDLLTGKPRRVLDGHPSTQVEPDVIVHADGQELRRPDNRKVKFSADGIALDRQGRFLYWQALTGKTLYRLPTNILTNPTVAPARLAAAVTKVGTTNVADGLWMDGKGNIWVTSPEEDALKLRAPDGTMQTVVQDKRLRWPDSLAEGPDGSIYVTSSHIQDMAQWHEKGSTLTEPYALWKVAGR